MLMIDKDRAYTTIIGRRRAKDGSTTEAEMAPSSVMNEERDADPRHEAMKDFLSAIQEKHPGKMLEAMTAFHDLHQMRETDKDAEQAD